MKAQLLAQYEHTGPIYSDAMYNAMSSHLGTRCKVAGMTDEILNGLANKTEQVRVLQLLFEGREA